MTEPYVTICDSNEGRDAWLAARNLGVGASDMPIVLGLSPWKSILELYAEKVGDAEPEDISQVEAIKWGNRLEGAIIQAYNEETGRYARRSGQLIRSVEYPWAQCTLDGVTCDTPDRLAIESREELQLWPLQAKNSSAWKAEEWEDGPPEMYVVQEHHEMLVTGAGKATIACLLGGNKLVWADIERDEDLIRKIIHHGEAFWRRVLDKKPPPPDGSEATKKALARLHPEDDGKTIELPGELREAMSIVQHRKAAMKVLKAELCAAENQIKAALGDATQGIFAGGGPSVSWKTQTRAEHLVKASTFRVLRFKK